MPYESTTQEGIMGTYKAVFSYELGAKEDDIVDRRHATLVIDAKNVTDAAHKVEAALQRLIGDVLQPAHNHPGSDLFAPMSCPACAAVKAHITEARKVLVSGDGLAETFAREADGRDPPFDEGSTLAEFKKIMTREQPTRDEFIRALGHMLQEHDELSDTVVLDHGEVPSFQTRNRNPNVAAARKLYASVMPPIAPRPICGYDLGGPDRTCARDAGHAGPHQTAESIAISSPRRMFTEREDTRCNVFGQGNVRCSKARGHQGVHHFQQGPSREDLIRALGAMLNAYDADTNRDTRFHEAHVEEARKLYASIVSKRP
jgi:hypothetical protein